jgi:hypothetical protein
MARKTRLARSAAKGLVPQAESVSASTPQLEQIVAELQRENKSLLDHNRKLKVTVAEAKRRSEVLEREKAKLAKNNEALRKSLSWRLTLPLRAVIGTCRAIGRQRPALQRERVEPTAVTAPLLLQAARKAKTFFREGFIASPRSRRSVPARAQESSQRIVKTMAMNKDKPTIGVIILTCGEPQFEACWYSVNAQSLEPDRIDVVRNMYPMSAAFNEALRLASCDYSVHVDADMVLDPHALETLYNDINSSEDNVFGIGYRLRDPYYGSIGHIKIFKSSLLRSRRVTNECGYDRLLVKELNNEGYSMGWRRETLGVHLPNPTPEELFKRALGNARRSLKFRGNDTKMIKLMARKWCVEDDKTAFAGLIGYCGGLLLEHEDEEKDFRTFGTKEWSSTKWMFEP